MSALHGVIRVIKKPLHVPIAIQPPVAFQAPTVIQMPAAIKDINAWLSMLCLDAIPSFVAMGH